MPRVLLVLAVTLTLASCGGEEKAQQPPPLQADDAFVVRMARHQQTALSLARSAAADGDSASVRRLARQMVATREKRLPALMERLTQVPSRDGLADLGVSADEAAESIRPDALAGAQPLDPAFLSVMAQHGQGALTLVRAELDQGRDPATKAIAQQLGVETARELDSLNRELVALARDSAG